MNKEKYECDKNFPFDSLCLANPSGLQGGAYFSKIKINDERILLQIPKCQTKNGIHITEKKIYTDLMHSSDKESFQIWIDTFTSKIKELLYEKKDIWFSNDMSSDDIDFFWKDVLRKYKKKFTLLRCYVKKSKYKNTSVMVYDEEENNLELTDIKAEQTIIPLVEITGLKFNSQSFIIEFTLKQIMVLSDQIEKKKCLINPMISSKNNESYMSNNKTLEKETPVKTLEKETPVKTLEKETPVKTLEKETPVKTLEKETPVKTLEKSQNLENNNNNSIIFDISNNLEEEDFIPDLTYMHKSKDVSSTLIDEIENKSNTLEEKDHLVEINLEYPTDDNNIKLKNPNEVYLEIYKEAKRRATEAKRAAIQAYLEVKRIKQKYMLDAIESSDEEIEELENV
jgi:hypothetical protein